MKLYKKWCDELYALVQEKRQIFLILNTLLFGVIGFFVWYVIHFFFLNRIDWLICFIGYPAVCLGYMGGLLYFMRMD